MAIKAFAYAAQQHFQSRTGIAFKRTHIYELLAAAYNFNSFAALNSKAILFAGSQVQAYKMHAPALRNRCLELGYLQTMADIVAAELPELIEQERINVVSLDALILRLRHQLSYRGYWDWQDEEYFDEEERLAHLISEEWPPFHDDSDQNLISQDLLTALNNAATLCNADAHYAIALIHAPINSDEQSPGWDYWYQQEQKGRVLTGVEKEWADSYAQKIASDKKYEHHLHEAGRLGHELALLDLAEYFDDPTFFKTAEKSADHDPFKIAELAQKLGRPQDAHEWLTIAAKAGDTEAMRWLVEKFDRNDLTMCWTWIYLSQLLDEDLTRDDFHAIHENGSAYDDDVGGPLYVDGREGIKLPSLTTEQDVLARQRAQALFEKIDQ
jgi:hypothetical protein